MPVFFLGLGLATWSTVVSAGPVIPAPATSLEGALLAPWSRVILALLVGYLFWTLLEYVLHRYVLHGPSSLAQEGHAKHHRDEEALVASPLFVIPLVEVVLWWLMAHWIGATSAAFFFCGAASGYAGFSLLHHVFHHYPERSWDRGFLHRLREGHEVHHQLARWNYGTTTSLWDRVFRTYRSPESVPAIVRART